MLGTLQEISTYIGGELIGDGSIVIEGCAPIEDAGEGDITFYANPKYRPFLETTRASVVIVPKEMEPLSRPVIKSEHPYMAFGMVLMLLSQKHPQPSPGVHPSAVLGENVTLGQDVCIMACVVLDDNARVGDRSILYPHVYVGRDSAVGCECRIYPNVTLRERVTLGDRVVIHSGTVLGADGFGFAQQDGMNFKIPQVGSVVIEDDVEIGANVCVDRGTMGKTVIKKGSKIDNLIQVAHNVIIGEQCVIASQTGISGSARIGNNVMMGGQVGVSGHLTVGDGVKVAAKSGISKSIGPGEVICGSPALPIKKDQKLRALARMLPDLYDRVDLLEKRLKEMEENAQKGGGERT